MRISTSLLYQRGVNAIEGQQVELSNTQEQLGTGERLKAPSDDPFASTRIVALQEQSETLEQYERNANVAKARLETEETSLNSVLNILQRMNELAIGMNNGTLSAENRIATSAEVFKQLDGLLQLANSRDSNGEYIFSGDKTNSVTFTDAGGGTYTYNGDQGKRYIQIGTARNVETADTGYEVFMNIPDAAGTGSKDMMQIVYDFATNLAAGNADPDAITEVGNALERVTGIMAKIGGRINVIDSQNSANESFNFSINETKSSLEDLDYADAISKFRQQLAGLQAAQQSFIEIQGLSLFNYI